MLVQRLLKFFNVSFINFDNNCDLFNLIFKVMDNIENNTTENNVGHQKKNDFHEDRLYLKMVIFQETVTEWVNCIKSWRLSLQKYKNYTDKQNSFSFVFITFMHKKYQWVRF